MRHVRKHVIWLTILAALLGQPSLAHDVYIDEQFNRSLPTELAPRWACDPVIPVTWKVLNLRSDFQSTNTNLVKFIDGFARIWSYDNSASGGYIGVLHDVHPRPRSWRLTTKVRVVIAHPERSVPECLVNLGQQQNSECSIFDDDDPAGKLGWQAGAGQQLILRDGDPTAYPIGTGYRVSDDGTWHIIELTSSDSGSEIRAWPEGGERPSSAMATGMSLGPARRVLFTGPNFQNFEYLVDYVKLETFGGADSVTRTGRVILEDHFNIDSAEVIAPTWICDPAKPITWWLGDGRADFQSSNTDQLQIRDGAARLFCFDNSAVGGYVALVCPVYGQPDAWRLFTRVKVDRIDGSDRGVPSCLVEGTATPAEPCNMFPNDTGSRGWLVRASDKQLLLRELGLSHQTGYIIPADGSWHNIELISGPSGSEIRAWPNGALRPTTPQASGASLGIPKRVHFGGPNFRNFDYSIDTVVLESM